VHTQSLFSFFFFSSPRGPHAGAAATVSTKKGDCKKRERARDKEKNKKKPITKFFGETKEKKKSVRCVAVPHSHDGDPLGVSLKGQKDQ
jgi:hypothetical protein